MSLQYSEQMCRISLSEVCITLKLFKLKKGHLIKSTKPKQTVFKCMYDQFKEFTEHKISSHYVSALMGFT